jgi:hypothetical protein
MRATVLHIGEDIPPTTLRTRCHYFTIYFEHGCVEISSYRIDFGLQHISKYVLYMLIKELYDTN